jgi:coproporphyrinogen III oxidase
MPNREEIAQWLKELQKHICCELEKADGKALFTIEEWQRPEGGGGTSKVIQNGNVIEKGGVNFSAVHGSTPSFLFTEKEHSSNSELGIQNSEFFATGLSIVIHPKNPMVPIIHMNIRYFEMSNGVHWLGGGIDLTPHYINENDAKFFHKSLKEVCDKHNPHYYTNYKKWADDYFFINHRDETRGIGGIFFDRLNETPEMNFSQNLAFWKDVGMAFAPLYVELINRNRNISFAQKEIEWQLIRRSRYAEFNLVYDKGTKFGLETNGRIESILMSLPPLAAWHYNYSPEADSAEAKTLSLLKKGINWVN